MTMRNPASHRGLALLFLRAGVGTISVLLLALKQAEPAAIFPPLHSQWPAFGLTILAFLVVCGVHTRLVAAILATAWMLSVICGIVTGALWSDWPIRSLLFFVIYFAIALAGPGELAWDAHRSGLKIENLTT